MRHAPLILLSLLATGCSNNAVLVDMDGQSAKVTLSGYFVHIEDIADDGDGALVVALNDADWDDPCETGIDREDEIEDADDYGELADVWDDFYDDEVWEALIVIRVDDTDDDQSGELFEGADADEALGEEEAYATLTHYTQALDEDYYEGKEDADDYVSEWITDRGDLVVQRHEPGERLKGTFTTEIGTYEYDGSDWDYDRVGGARFSFDVQRCHGIEDYW